LSDQEEILSALKEDYRNSLTRESTDGFEDDVTKQYLIFTLAGTFFGIETACCRQVLRVPDIVALPEVPSHILGVINLRGRIVSVTSLALLMGLSQSEITPSSRLVVITNHKVTTAILADSVKNIIECSESNVQEVGQNTTGAEFAVSEVFEGKDLLLLLSSQKILSAKKMIIDVRG